MVNILHGFMTKDTTVVLPLHMFHKIVLYQPPCVWIKFLQLIRYTLAVYIHTF